MSTIVNKVIVDLEQNLDDDYKTIARNNIDAISLGDTEELITSGISGAFTTHDEDETCHKDIRDTISGNYTTLSSFIQQEVTERISSYESITKEISEMDVQSNWDEDDTNSKSFIQHKPTPISEIDIEGLFA